jgi:predicted O-linked N-acetylglucosamine transferase (SPINDLY family)
MSSFKTTDAYLDILREQPRNFAKILTLYSARNTVKFEYKALFDANPQLACFWYSCFSEIYRSGLVNKQAYQNLREHLTYSDDRLTDFYNINDVYFGATYIDGDRDREIKQKINRSIRKSPFCTTAQIKNTPNPKKVAVITSLWFSQHSVYRTLSEFVESLKDDYELTLVHLGGIITQLDIGSFKGIRSIYIQDNSLNIDSIRENDFMVVYYLDIGMSPESILLSNLRLAPIQLCGTGHPVSTFGSEIDYFISSADVEIPESAEENYSERLVLLPGFGAIHNKPTYQIRNIDKNRPKFIINCSWFSQKINYPLVCHLKEILKESKKDIIFRFFSGSALIRKNDFIPFARDLESLLGKAHVDLVPAKPYDEYMALMEEGDICIESYHFGGSNTVADSLYLRKPTVTFEGNKWYNRIGSQMLRVVGLEELIAKSAEEYIRLTLKLIHDDKYRLSIQKKLKQADLSGTIFSSASKNSFKKAIGFLIENHEQLKHENARKPIRIQE